MDRDHKLRVVGVESPASVSRAPLPLREDRPPEYASPEAMLRWARAQRSGKKLAPESAEGTKKPQKKFASLAFAALDTGDIRPVDESVDSAPLAYVRKKRPLKFYAISGSIVLALAFAALTGIFFVDFIEQQPLIKPAEKTATANDVQHSPVPDTFVIDEHDLSAGAKKLTNDPVFFPAVGFSHRIRFVTPGQVTQIVEPEIQAVSPGSVVYSVPPTLKLDGFDSELNAINVPLLGKFAPLGLVPSPIASIDDSGQFAPPAQYSRQDLGSGVGELLKLITGQDQTLNAESSVQTDALIASKPLIYVHHGLGVSPETVRKVMQKLASNGYERIYQIGVPFRIGRTNVRFYHATDMNLAKEIAGAVIPLVDGPQFSEPRDFSRYSKPPRAGTIDIWLSDKA